MNEGITSHLIFSSLSGEVVVHSEEFGLLLYIEIYFNPYAFCGGVVRRSGKVQNLRKCPH